MTEAIGLSALDRAVGAAGLAGDIREQASMHDSVGAAGGGVVKELARVLEGQIGDDPVLTTNPVRATIKPGNRT